MSSHADSLLADLRDNSLNDKDRIWMLVARWRESEFIIGWLETALLRMIEDSGQIMSDMAEDGLIDIPNLLNQIGIETLFNRKEPNHGG